MVKLRKVIYIRFLANNDLRSIQTISYFQYCNYISYCKKCQHKKGILSSYGRRNGLMLDKKYPPWFLGGFRLFRYDSRGV